MQRKKKIKEFYLASSSEVYQTPNKIPTDEDEIMKIPNAYNPRCSYGGAKILSELIAINYGKPFLKKMIIFAQLHFAFLLFMVFLLECDLI